MSWWTTHWDWPTAIHVSQRYLIYTNKSLFFFYEYLYNYVYCHYSFVKLPYHTYLYTHVRPLITR